MFRLRRSTISIHRLFSSSSSVGEREILLDHLDSGISILTLNRPSRKNALGRTLLNDLRSTFQQLSAQPTRVLIVRSAVPGVFCAGADLKERMEMNPAQVNAFVSSLRMCFRELENLPQPTIAVIEGSALGGGLELAMACDFRIGSRNAIVGLPETGLAIIPGAGGTQRLARLVGPNMAKRLIFTAEKIEAERAKEINILDILADQDKDAMQVAIEFAQKIIPNVSSNEMNKF